MSKLELYLQEKLGMGNYQWTMFIFSFVPKLAAGFLLYSINTIPTFIQRDRFLTNDETKYVIIFLNIGQLFGGLTQGPLVDKIGRSPSIKINMTIAVLIYFLFFFELSLYSLYFISFIFGNFVAFILSAMVSFVSEILSLNIRNKGVIIFNSFISSGRLIAALLSVPILSPYSFEKWKLLLMIAGVMLSVSMIPFLFLTKESLKFLFSKKEYQLMFDTWKEIEQFNGQNDENKMLKISDLKDIKSEREMEESKYSNLQTQPSLMDPQYLYLNFATFVNYAVFYMLSNGHIMMLPVFIGVDSKSLLANGVIMSGEVLSSFICYFIISHPLFGGRRIMLFSAFFNTLLFLMGSFVDRTSLILVMFLIRILIKSFLASWTVFTSEEYPTLLKGKAMSISLFFGGGVNIIFPYFFFYCISIDKLYIMYFLSLCCAVSTVVTFYLKTAIKREEVLKKVPFLDEEKREIEN